MLDEVDYNELEWAIREYCIVTDHLHDVLSTMHDSEVPESIRNAIQQLAAAVAAEWDENPRG